MATEPVIVALGEQVEGYRALAKLAEAQHRHVQNGQTESLLDILQRRQGVLDRIVAAEQTVGPAKRAWAEFAAGLAADDRASAEGMLRETRQLLEQITTADRNDAVVLQQRKITLGRQIDRTAAAKAVNRNYAAAAYGPRRPTVDVQL